MSFLKKRINLPSLQEIKSVVRILSLREKYIFFILTIIFVVSILGIVRIIIGNSLIEIPAAGGTLREGIIGTPRFINPLLEISDADRDMVSLVYSGLLRSDNKKGLIPDLAEKYEVSDDGLFYTFTLKPELKWHDNHPITSDDVVFTVEQARDSVLNSPKRGSWEGVRVEKIDERIVSFTLDKPYIPFLENTTLGILPKHIWKNIPPEQISFSDFNIKPVGSGPYKVEKISRNSSGILSSYTLESYSKFALGKPYIKKIILKFYPSVATLMEAYKKGEIDSISAVSPKIVQEIKKGNDILKTPLLTKFFGVFFNQNNAKVFTQDEVRKALSLAIDKERIINEVLNGYGTKLEYPLPPGILGALEESGEEILTFNLDKAKSTLENEGWKINEETNILEKKSKKESFELRFSISTSDTPELKEVAQLTKSMWEELGAIVDLKIFEIGDLKQGVIRSRNYEALLFGGVITKEPDPFAFWHSSQRNDPGLNIAMYANIKVDKILEEARTISDKEKREEKYKEFQKEVVKDMPAVFLYSPLFTYIVPEYLRMINDIENITIASERFSQIHTWYIRTRKIFNSVD